MATKSSIAIVGAGSLANCLGPALREAGYRITEVISRNTPESLRRARPLARKLRARVTTAKTARLDSELIWLCVPDRQIQRVAQALAHHGAGTARAAFHSSGALSSRELEPLRMHGIAVASVHPLMTFVPGAWPSFVGIPFAAEGDMPATRLARRIIRDLGGESFTISGARKAAYHAWATMSCPLLVAYLVTLEEAGGLAGLTRADARRKSFPIIRETLANYWRRGPAQSFSGPIVRGDVETVAKHLSVLSRDADVREVYLALARSALKRLPVKNRRELARLLRN